MVKRNFGLLARFLWLVSLLVAINFALPGAAESAEAVSAENYMVTAANPYAGQAGLEILQSGGSAVDAAIAVQLVLSMVEPQSSGIGGGAFLMTYDSGSGALEGYDGRETAPSAADETLFLDDNGEPIGFFQAMVGGRSVGVPGIFRLFELAHEDHGTLPWADLFGPAIRLAESGFELSPRLFLLLDRDPALANDPEAGPLLYDGDEPKPVGTKIVNQPYADLLRVIAAEGPDAYYQGAIAERIVEAVSGHQNPGLLSLEDLAGYRAIKRTPICGAYRAYEVCGMAPPTSGGTTVLSILGTLNFLDLGSRPVNSAPALHLIIEASRLAFADRGLYLGDADFVDVPVQGLIDPAYLEGRARLIDPTYTAWPNGEAPPAGYPYGVTVADRSAGVTFDTPSTSHWNVVDGEGNVAAITSSVQTAFGSHIMIDGYILNNQLTDFAFRSESDGSPAANRVQAGKRPLSSMSPTIVFDARQRPFLVVGSPGGTSIIAFVVKAITGVVDWDLNAQDAVSMPNYTGRGAGLTLEEGTSISDLDGPLAALGHDVRVRSINSGLHAIRFHWDGDDYTLTGGADHRREGVVLGE